jgi:hypothetical protein
MKVLVELVATGFGGAHGDGGGTTTSRTTIEADAKELELLQRLERQMKAENRRGIQPYMNVIVLRGEGGSGG